MRSIPRSYVVLLSLMASASGEAARARDDRPNPMGLSGPLVPPSRSLRERPTHTTAQRSRLVGRWRGDDFTLTIDQDAVQANRDPAMPFQWDPLHILDVRENMIVFELGGDRYIALVVGDGMTLTQAGSTGYRNLTRER